MTLQCTGTNKSKGICPTNQCNKRSSTTKACGIELDL